MAFVLALSPAPTRALIIASGNGNTAAPADDPGWANIGRLHGSGAGTFIYLGNKKVLTAAHIGLNVVATQSQVRFGGVGYTPVAGSGVRLKNPDNSDTDLVVFEIDADPGLPAVTIGEQTPGLGAELLLIGEGLNRQALQFYWDVDTTDPNDWTWTEVPNTDPFDYTGFKWGGSVTRRWGTNAMFDNDVDFTGLGDVEGFATLFNLGLSGDEANAAAGDSGGAVFFKNPDSNQWELSGVIIGTGYLAGIDNPPAQTVIDGQSVTLAADLSIYRSQIVALVPEPSTVTLAAAAVPMLLAWRLASRRRKKAPL